MSPLHNCASSYSVQRLTSDDHYQKYVKMQPPPTLWNPHLATDKSKTWGVISGPSHLRILCNFCFAHENVIGISQQPIVHLWQWVSQKSFVKSVPWQRKVWKKKLRFTCASGSQKRICIHRWSTLGHCPNRTDCGLWFRRLLCRSTASLVGPCGQSRFLW
jgi:hypothetical protein